MLCLNLTSRIRGALQRMPLLLGYRLNPNESYQFRIQFYLILFSSNLLEFGWKFLLLNTIFDMVNV